MKVLRAMVFWTQRKPERIWTGAGVVYLRNKYGILILVLVLVIKQHNAQILVL